MRANILRLLRELVPDWVYRLSVPQRRFSGDVTIRPSGGRFSYFTDEQSTENVDVFELNLETVLKAAATSDTAHITLSSTWARRPSIAIGRDGVRAFISRLEELGSDHPIYVGIQGPTGTKIARVDRLATFAVDASQVTRLNVFCPRFDQRTGRRFGHGYGCLVEVWDDDLDLAADPAGMPKHRDRAPHSAMQSGDRGYAPMDPFVSDLPIDAVYLWVDGADTEWQRRKSKRMSAIGSGVEMEATMSARFMQYDELRFSLRSLERFAPWIRRVFLVTDRQRPDWLDEAGTNLTIVDHTDLLPTSALPTFNSHALAANIHNIDGLAEHFLYMNDDMLFGRPIRPELFFHSNGVARFFLSRTRLARDTQIAHEIARLTTAAMIESKLGFAPERVLKHAPYAINRSVMESLETVFPHEWQSTTHSPFRSGTDFVPEFLHHHFSYADRKSTPGSIEYDYVAFGGEFGHTAITKYLHRPRLDVICVNDQGVVAGDGSGDIEALLRLFERDYPRPSSYERSK